MLKEARAVSHRLLTERDTAVMRTLTVTPAALRAQMRAGYESTTPIGLIHLYEEAMQGLLSPEETEKIRHKFNEQKAQTSQARVEGQQGKRLMAQRRREEIAKNFRIQNLIQRLGPTGNLTPNGAAALAIRLLGSVMPKKDIPSQRTLRRLFVEKAKLLATQRP